MSLAGLEVTSGRIFLGAFLLKQQKFPLPPSRDNARRGRGMALQRRKIGVEPPRAAGRGFQCHARMPGLFAGTQSPGLSRAGGQRGWFLALLQGESLPFCLKRFPLGKGIDNHRCVCGV